MNGGTPRVFPEGIGIMAVTLVVNVFVVVYELRAGRRLKSEVLNADAMHTRSDVLTSGAVLGALIAVWWGFPLLDPLAALLVAGFIGRAGWQIATDASRILSDEIVIDEDDVRTVVCVGAEGHRLRENPDTRLDRPCVHGPACLARQSDASSAGARQVARGEGQAHVAISSARGRGDSHRAASSRRPASSTVRSATPRASAAARYDGTC